MGQLLFSLGFHMGLNQEEKVLSTSVGICLERCGRIVGGVIFFPSLKNVHFLRCFLKAKFEIKVMLACAHRTFVKMSIVPRHTFELFGV